jgi:cytidine kinase
MPLCVVGSLAIDHLITPRGEYPNCLGGSASYFSYVASFFAPVRLVGVVGQDFPQTSWDTLKSRKNIDTSGVQVQPGKTFYWKGEYSADMNSRETLDVQLGVFGEFDPVVPEQFKDSELVFLGNAPPAVQRKVLQQVPKPKLSVCDTMDLWINIAKPELLHLLKEVDGVVMNDSEATLLTGDKTMVGAGRRILDLGPKFVVVKKGEHGAMLFSEFGVVTTPAYPIEDLVDPTGAGDTFAGGMMGYLAGAGRLDHAAFKRALAYGTVVASFTCEGFSLDRLKKLTRKDIEDRFVLFREMLNL